MSLLTGAWAAGPDAQVASAAGTAGAPWTWGTLYTDVDGITGEQLTPVQVPRGWQFTDVSWSGGHALALGTDGALYVWGMNSNGSLGTGGSAGAPTPVRVDLPGGRRAVRVTAGSSTSAAIAADGSLWMWGSGDFGSFGVGYPIPAQATPLRAPLPGGLAAVEVWVGWYYTIVLASDGRAYTAGSNWYYDLGDGTTQHRSTFVQVAIPGDARLAAVTYKMALGTDGTVYTWGPNNSGQLGTGSTAGWTDVRVAALPTGVKATAIASMGDHRLALGDNGRVYAWGSNTRGQLGDGTRNDRWTPTAVSLPAGVRAVSVHAGLDFSAAVGDDGRLYQWGGNFWGNLGDGTRTDRWTPVVTRLPDDATLAAVSVGGSSTVALLTSTSTPPAPTTTTTTTTTTTVPGGTGTPPTTAPPVTPPITPPVTPPATGTGTARPGSGFTAVTPRRVLDTRDLGAPVAAGTAHVLDLSAVVPADATDVVANITATQPAGPGFVTVYPCAADRPLASNLNLAGAGHTVPNLATVALGDDARLCLYASVTTHLVVDLAGWYEAEGGSGLVAVSPRRLLDTRMEDGVPVGRDGVVTIDLRGVVGADADAVVVNVTATGPAGDGFVTVFPCAAPRPLASNLNVTAGRTVANLATVAIGADQGLCLYTSTPTHLVVDLAAWYAPSSIVGYVGLVPERVFDTRDELGAVPAGGSIQLRLGPGPATPQEIVAVVLNVTAVEPDGAGFVTVFPCAAGRPTASNLNVDAGGVVPNLVVAPADDQDDVCFYVHTTMHLIADAAGYFTAA